jgi:hypothetical protein
LLLADGPATSSLQFTLKFPGATSGHFEMLWETFNDEDCVNSVALRYNNGSWSQFDPATGWSSGLDEGTQGSGSGSQEKLDESNLVPEPVTMAGVLLAVGSLGGYLRRRRRT